MDFRFDRIRDHIEGCLLDAGVFERTIDGAQLFDVDIVSKANKRWLVIAAGVTDPESAEFFSDRSKRDRSTTPMQVVPAGTASILLIVRPLAKDASGAPNVCVTEFSTDVGAVELYQGSYVRVDALQHPTVQQIRWEFDPIAGHKPPQEAWLRRWAKLVECNPAHAPSHWHINSPPTEDTRPRHRRQPILLPELRLATGLPNPLLLLLSLSNWLRRGYQLSPD